MPPTTFLSDLRARSNAIRSIPSSWKGTQIVSISKSSSILKCLSKPGVGQIKLGLFMSFHAFGWPIKYMASTV